MPANAAVLVTGAAGFVGSHLVDRLLAEGRRVVAVDDLSTGRLANLDLARRHGVGAFEFQRLDVSSEAVGTLMGRHQPEIVFHLAARVSVAGSVAEPIADATTNVLGTLRLLEAARRHAVRKVVFVSCAGIYGNPPVASLPLDERASTRPCSPHAAGKLAAEAYLQAYGGLGIAWTSVVPGNTYGPRQRGADHGAVVAELADRMKTGQPVVVHGDGNQTRDFVFVDDLVHALVLAMDRGDGHRLNVGTGERHSVNTLFGALSTATGYGHGPVTAPPRAGDVRHSALDPSRAGELLGWKPWTPLEEGLAATLRHAADAHGR